MKKEIFPNEVKKICILLFITILAGASALQAQSSGKINSHKNHNKNKTKLVQTDTSAVSTCKDKKAMNMSGSCCAKAETSSKSSVNDKKSWNEVCPVLGDKVNPEIKPVEYKGKLYGFCCAGCDAKFKADPEKYSKRLSQDGKSITE